MISFAHLDGVVKLWRKRMMMLMAICIFLLRYLYSFLFSILERSNDSRSIFISPALSVPACNPLAFILFVKT